MPHPSTEDKREPDMAKKIAKADQHKFISWGPGSIGQLDEDAPLDVKCDFISLHPKIGPFELPEVRIDDVDINLPTDKVLGALGFISEAILKQIPFVDKIPLAKEALSFLTGK